MVADRLAAQIENTRAFGQRVTLAEQSEDLEFALCQAVELRGTRRALARFWELRNSEAIQKKPATAELLVWLAVLSARRVSVEELHSLKNLPAREALIKDREDQTRLDESLP